jgi:hypothetical protein
MADRQREAADPGPHTLWFSPPDGDDGQRRALTRERVVAEALATIGADGVDVLSMRALAARLGVPAAMSRTRAPGSWAMHSRAWAWLIRKPQLYGKEAIVVSRNRLLVLDCQCRLVAKRRGSAGDGG